MGTTSKPIIGPEKKQVWPERNRYAARQPIPVWPKRASVRLVIGSRTFG